MDKKDLSTVFSRIAPRYDFLNHVLSFNQDQQWRKEVAELANIQQAKILDLCTGTGELAIAFTRHESSCQVVGVDFSSAMLARLAEKIKKRGFSNRITLTQADVFSLPFAHESFDIVAMGFGLRNLIDYPRGVATMVKMAKPGGHVLILEFSAPRKSTVGSLAHFYLHRILPCVAGIFGGSFEAYQYLSSSILSFLSPEQIIECLRYAGVKNIGRKNVLCGAINIYYGEK